MRSGQSASGRWPVVFLGLLLLTVCLGLAWSRVGLLDLPAVSAGITGQESGLADLEALRVMNEYLWSESPLGDKREDSLRPIDLVRHGMSVIKNGSAADGLALIQKGLRLDPRNLVFGNAYRMIVFRLRREHLFQLRRNGDLTIAFPSYLERQPISFFDEIAKTNNAREIKLQLALAWVDEMLLFPALEIKAPASVESVRILDEILVDHPHFVPALLARGLNHLHRPARLVWPETTHVAVDAAARDISLCVAVGRHLNVGSDRLRAALSMDLGDSYVKAGRFSKARSWWQIAINTSKDRDIGQAIRRRFAWLDENILDQLEHELDHMRSQLDQPMTDLAMMWN